MTEKQKHRRNSFAADFNAREDDFILADLNVMPDEEEPSPVPLNHFLDDEDVIDRLLVDAGFDVNDEFEEVDGKPNALVIDDISLADEFDVNFDEQNVMTTDTAIFDPEKSKLALEKDGDGISMVQEENPETVKQEQTIVETTAEIKPELVLDNSNNPGITELNSLKSEREAIKKLISDYENKVKKAAVISYASLGIGFVALLSTVVMGVIISSAQTKISKLSDLVSILEEDMGSIAGKNSDLAINNSDPSIEQLNQKANGLPEHLEEQTLSSQGISENEMTADVTKPATVNKSLDKLQTKTPVPEKKKPSEAAVKKVSAEKKGNKTQTAAGWSVNLTAYEDLSYAKTKAIKFIQKGIPVKVIAVNMNNTKWYRLKVGGFKNKEEATSYAAKIKKSLNLNSVSVGNN